ncbi:MAG: DUF4133 domain-containing protein [Bacteroidota bacterium]
MSSVYVINKGVNKPIVFRGLKAQYIWWLGIGLAVLVLVFTILYIIGIPVVFCLIVVFGSGGYLFWWVYKMSRTYGEHGLMKKNAERYIPRALIIKRTFL